MSDDPVRNSDLIVGGALCFVMLVSFSVILGCAPSTETLIKGDREVVQVTAGKITTQEGDSRYFYILRDKDTGVDYLAVVDAGIVRLDERSQPAPPKPPQVERP